MTKQNEIVLTGKIDSIFGVQAFGNYFEKRVFWLVEQVEDRPNFWQLELQQGECSTLDKFKPGELVICNVEILGKKLSKNGKEFIFNNLHCTQIKKVS